MSENASIISEEFKKLNLDISSDSFKCLEDRGYTTKILKSFVSNCLNGNVEDSEYSLTHLSEHAFHRLKDSTVSVMVVLEPLEVELTGLSETLNFEAPDFPLDLSRGSHGLSLGPETGEDVTKLFIDRRDFRPSPEENFFGLLPGRVVTLKYALLDAEPLKIRCDDAVNDESGIPCLLKCSVVRPDTAPHIGSETESLKYLPWVSVTEGIPVDLTLFSTDSSSGWEDPRAGEVTIPAVADPSLQAVCLGLSEDAERLYVCFEGMGYFVLDNHSVTGESGRLHFLFTCPPVVELPSVSMDDLTASRLLDLQARESELGVSERAELSRLLQEKEKEQKLLQVLSESTSFRPSNASQGTQEDGKITTQQRLELLKLKSEQESQAKVEALKRQKLLEIQGLEGLSVAERGQLALAKAEKEAQERVEQLKREKMKDFQSTGAGSGDGTGKLSVAARGELALQQAEKEAQARLEQLKREKMKEFAGSEGIEGTGKLSVLERGELALLKAEQEAQARVEQLKREKMEDFLRAKEEGVKEEEEDEHLSPLQRKEMMKEREEKMKQQRLQEFLHVERSESVGSEDASATKGSIQSRYEYARKKQLEAENERLEKFKNNPDKKIQRSGSLKDKWPGFTNSEDSPSAKNDEKRKILRKGTSVKNMWEDVLNESKNSEENRFKLTKKQTQSQYHMTDGTGIVKRRIGEWEELFMQLAVSGEELENTLSAALALSEMDENMTVDQMTAAQKEFRDNSSNPERFEIGETHIYPAKLLDHRMFSYIKRALNESKMKHLALSCGVYGNTQGKPPIDVYAAAIKNDADKIFLALTIKAAAGQELNPEVYGVKKIAVFGKDSGEKVMERVVDVVPMKGWEGWVEQAKGEAAKVKAGLNSSSYSAKSIEEDEILDDDIYVEGSWEESPAAKKEKEKFTNNNTNGTSPMRDSSNLGNSVLYMSERGEVEKNSILKPGSNGDGSTEDNFISVNASIEAEANENSPVRPKGVKIRESPEPQSLSQQGMSELPIRRMSSIEREAKDVSDDEVEDDDDPIGFNPGRHLSVARVGMARSFLPDTTNLNVGSGSGKGKKSAWTIADERDRDLPAADQATVYLSLRDIVGFSCSTSFFIIESGDGSNDTNAVGGGAWRGGGWSDVFTGTLKHGSSASRLLLQGDKVFEWIRGAAASGWLLKWPMKSQKFGRRSRRFFVLRDHILSYHNGRPQTEDEVYSNYAVNSVHLTENSSVAIGRYYLLRCITVTTPLDKAWIRMRNGSKDEHKWMTQLQLAIEQQAKKKLFLTKMRVESKWHHESPNFSLLSVDASAQPHSADRYLAVALFSLKFGSLLPKAEEDKTLDPSVFRDSTLRSGSRDSSSSNPLSFYSEHLYSLDIDSSMGERMQLEIVRVNESSALPSDLHCVKIFAPLDTNKTLDPAQTTVLLGGSRGFVGVGVVGRSSGILDGNPRPVVFCVPCSTPQAVPSSTPSQIREESETSTVDESVGVSTIHVAPDTTTTAPPTPPTTSPEQTYTVKSSALPSPHRADATVISFATAVLSDVFVAADDHCVLSLWFLPRDAHKTSKTVGEEGMAAANAKVSHATAEYCSSFCLRATDPVGHFVGEKVMKMHFLPKEEHLVVSTNRRLLILVVDNSMRPVAGNVGGRLSLGSSARLGEGVFRVKGWVEVDKSYPGKTGLFAMHVSEEYVPGVPGAATAELKRRITQWRVVEEEGARNTLSMARYMQPTVSSANKSPNGSPKHVGNASPGVRAQEASAGVTRCSIYRFEWTEEMFAAAMAKVRPVA